MNHKQKILINSRIQLNKNGGEPCKTVFYFENMIISYNYKTKKLKWKLNKFIKK